MTVSLSAKGHRQRLLCNYAMIWQDNHDVNIYTLQYIARWWYHECFHKWHHLPSFAIYL